MRSTKQEVVIVLSDAFAPSLMDLAVEHHVWAVRTAETEKVAQEIWKERSPLAARASSGDITLFAGEGDAEADLLSVIDTVELHHGIAASEQPAANTLRVMGAVPTEAVRSALNALGFTRIEPVQDGFVAHWHRL